MKDDSTHRSDHSHLVWEDLGSEMLYQTPIFALRTVHRVSPDGRRAPFISVEAPSWVTVIAEMNHESEDPGFLIVRQYRHGTGKVGLEFPAGVVDPGEEPEEAAARELLEETGYRAGRMELIGAVSPNPAFMTNRTSTYLARDLQRVSDELKLDANELLDTHVVSYSELTDMMGREPFDSAITVQAWFFYLSAAGRLAGSGR